MSPDKNVSRFYESTRDLKIQISADDRAIDRLKECFEQNITGLQKHIVSCCAEVEKKTGKSDFAAYLSQTVASHISDCVEEWKNQQKRSIASSSLRDVTNDSLLVIVYGKVKAGKSTLINFIANKAPDTMEKSFFRFDKAGNRESIGKLEELHGDCLETRITECTDTIQGLRLEGVTFVDTPGLLSMTKENGELARKYIEAADLIIYPLSGDSPGRHTDLEELTFLAQRGKEFCLLITKSDYIEEDEVDGELVSVMKNNSPKDRRDQEQYVRRAAAEKLKDVCEGEQRQIGDILSISVGTAKEYPEGSQEWQESNIPRLYSMLNDIIEKDSLRLKTVQPLENTRAVFREFIDPNGKNSLHRITDELSGQCRVVKEKQQQLCELKKKAVTESIHSVSVLVEEAVLSAHSRKCSASEIAQQLNTIVTSELKRTFDELFVPLLSELNRKLDLDLPETEINGKGLEFCPKTKTVKISNEIAARGTGGALGGVGGALAGAKIGTLIAPGVGTAIGFVLGGALGGFLGNETGNLLRKAELREIAVGDNLDEVLDRAQKAVDKKCEAFFDTCIGSITANITKPLIALLESAVNNTNKTISTIEKEMNR